MSQPIHQLGRLRSWCERHGYTLRIRWVWTLPPRVVAGARLDEAARLCWVDVGQVPQVDLSRGR